MRSVLVHVAMISVLAVPAGSIAAESLTEGVLASVLELERNVLHVPAGSLRQIAVEEPGLGLVEGDRIRTLADSSATLLFEDGSEAHLLERSLLVLTGQESSDVGAGRVLFDIRRQGTGGGIAVTSRTVVIGVKGTRFVVDSSDEFTSIFMGEGSVELTPESGAFRKYRQEVLSEFADYRRDQLEAYADFLRARGIEPFEIVDRLELTAGQAMLVDGDILFEVDTPEDIARLLAEYRSRTSR